MLMINATTIVKGGAIQVGVWFIRTCLEKKIPISLAVSKEIYIELKSFNISFHECDVLIIDDSPSKSKKSRKKLLEFEKKNLPKVVFTIFGPAYVNFKTRHVMGFADGWLTHSSLRVVFYTYRYSLINYIKLLVKLIYKAFWVKKANFWILETETAAKGLSKRLLIPQNLTKVVHNNCSKEFIYEKKPANQSEKVVHDILYFTADYKHKGIINIPYIAHNLRNKDRDLKFKFIITIDENCSIGREVLAISNKLNIADSVVLIGKVNVSDAVELVDRSSIILQLSYLETFSANYPEAMARGKPLIVSDFIFAHEICRDAALYVNPNNYNQVANAIHEILTNNELQVNLCHKGKAILDAFPSPDNRFKSIIDIIFKQCS